MKPVIGITLSMEANDIFYKLHSDSSRAINQMGGIPFMLSYEYTTEDIARIAQMMDGLVLTGGDDIDPTLFSEEPHLNLGPVVPARDHFELAVTRKMLTLDKPVLGICRGAQILNIAAGGDMYQDIYEQNDHVLLQHTQKSARTHATHYVEIVQDSMLHTITKKDKIRVNSVHHQANRKVCNGFYVSGRSSDGIIEAIESSQHQFALGVQWHPESMMASEDDVSVRIYRAFINACKM